VERRFKSNFLHQLLKKLFATAFYTETPIALKKQAVDGLESALIN
jgi:hypothetical protein